MQITKINSFNTNYYRQQNNYAQQPLQTPQRQEMNNAQELNFEGFNLKYKKQFGKLFLTKKNEKNIKYFTQEVTTFLGVQPKDIQKYITLDKRKNMSFYYEMARKMYLDAHVNKVAQPKNSLEILDALYTSTPNPRRLHFSILKNTNYTFEESSTLIKLANQDEASYNLIRELHRVPNSNNSRQNLNLGAENIASIVQSPNAAKLSENFDAYRSYISLNHEKPDFLEGLFKELSLPKTSFEPEVLNKQLAIKALKENPILREIPDEVIMNNWNEEAFKLFNDSYLFPTQTLLPKGAAKGKEVPFLEFLLNTTNKENFALRKQFFRKFAGLNDEQNTPEAVTNFLQRIDNDKHFRKLFKESCGTSLAQRPVTELMYYTDVFGAELLAKKSNRFFNIVHSNSSLENNPNKVVKVLSENLNNRYYLSSSQKRNLREREYNTRITDELTGNLRATLMRAKRKFKYEFLPKIFGTGESVPVRTQTDYATYHSIISKA